MKIAVAGTGYVGLSMAILLAQHNTVKAVDIIPEKVEMINNKKSPIVDKEIEEYLENKDLDLEATTDGDSAYRDADLVVISTPTNYRERDKTGYKRQFRCGHDREIHCSRWLYRGGKGRILLRQHSVQSRIFTGGTCTVR